MCILLKNVSIQDMRLKGSGCGAIDRAVDFDTKGPGFKTSHRQLLLNNFVLTVCWKKRKEKDKKRPGMYKLTRDRPQCF